MEGSVSTFLADRGYGFIKGDDGRDYFLHQSDLVPASVQVAEGARLSFEPSASPKGYRARKVQQVGSVGPRRYRTPDQMMYSRESAIKGWETLDASLWTVTGSGRGDPAHARQAMLAHAKRLGANAVVLMTYSKTTGQEQGTGRGTHHFTIHHFRGHPVVVGRASVDGSMEAGSEGALSERAGRLKELLVLETRRSRAVACVTGLGIAAAGVLASLHPRGGGMFAMVAGVILGIITMAALAHDHDGWLQPPR